MVVRGRTMKKHKFNRGKSRSKSRAGTSKKDVECFHCGKKSHYKKDCYKWKRENGDGKKKDNDARDKTKSNIKIEELNATQSECSSHDDHLCAPSSATNEELGDVLLTSSFDDAFLLTHERSMPMDWVIDNGASFHVMPHRLWFHDYDASRTGFDWQTYSSGHQFSGQAKEEFLKKRAFGLMGTFGMSNVSSTTFSLSTADVAAISNMKANAAEKLKEKQQCLEAIKIALDQSKTKRDEQVGLIRGAAKIIERLNKDMEELKLHKAGLVPNEEAMAKLETLIQIKKEALKDTRLDIEVHNLNNLGEEATQFQVINVLIPYDMKLIVDSFFDHFVSFLLVIAKKDPMEGIFGSPVDGIGEDTLDQQKAKKRAKKRADVVGAQGDASKESPEVPLKQELAMNKDVEDAEKSSEKPIEKDTTVNLFDEDKDLLISNVCGEILGRRKKTNNTEEHATPKKKAKVASKPPEPTHGGKKFKEHSSSWKKTNLQAPNLKPPKPKSRKKLL
ncbi:hypothetical protein L7F22_039847 [Adiantum nelumboides]|nr:hypothetical protein [Adiantum nelumboides]